nr:MAG TPA: hypothetical protein [Caudoviricetes sp.]
MANDIDKTSPHYKGEFGSIYEVNQKFPSGGVEGDYVAIDGWAHYWNADRATWCVNAERDSYWDELITNIIEKFKLVRGATYMGVASLDTVPAKAIGAKMYYFATVAGTYKNFGDLVVPQGINVLYSENGSSWVNTTLLEVAQELGVNTNKVVSQKTLNDALAKKFDKDSVVQESGEAEDKVMSQKAVSDKLSDLSNKMENPWFAGGKALYNRLTNLTKAAQSLYHVIKDIWIETDNTNIKSEEYYLKLGVFALDADSLTQIKEGIKNAIVGVYLTNGTDNIALSANFKINNISDKYSLKTSNGTIHFILDLNDLDFSDIPATTEGYGHLILNQGLTKEYYIISKKKTSKYDGIVYGNELKEKEAYNVKKTDIITSWNEVAPYLQNKAIDAYQTLSIQNQFGTIEENKFINIYGKSSNDYAGNANYFNPRCVSNWIPINSYTRNRYLKNLVSNVKAGVAGIALYSNFSEANFIGYYKPSNDTLKGNDVLFSVSIEDVLNSSEEFKNAKFFRFTHRKNDEGTSPKTHILENMTKGFLKSDGTIFEHDGDYAISDYILLNDDVCNLTLNGLISYTRANIYPIVFYNKNKEIIGQGYKNPADDGSTTAPIVCSIKIKDIIGNYPQASYVRFLYDTTYGIEVLTNIDINSEAINNQDNSWCLNQFRNVICIGDSVTQGFVSDYPTYQVVPEASYPTKLGYLVTGWNITNAGRSGDSPSDWLNGNSSGKESMFSKYTFTNYDLAIIEFGYNGGLYEKDIATEGTNTYNYDQIIKKIKEVNPNIQIVLMIPSNGIIVRNWESVIQTLANNNDCKVVDLKEDLHVHLDNKKWHGNSDLEGTLDMVHFTQKGYNAKAKVVFDKLVKLFAY